jgi:hypothetical protein
VPTYLLIHAAQTSPALDERGVAALEDDLHDFLGAAGETTYSGIGCGLWSIDITLHESDAGAAWVERLSRFLEEWGAPPETSIREVRPPNK